MSGEAVAPTTRQEGEPLLDEADEQTAVQRFSYRLFMGVVGLNALLVLIAYYVLNLPEPVEEVLRIVDLLNALIFFADFVAQLVISPNKARYFFIQGGWIDLLGSLPVYPLLRILRIARSIKAWRQLAKNTAVEVRRAARRRFAESSLFVTATLVLLIVTAGSILIAVIEPPAAGANIKTGSDAVWFVLVTVATVGYGDRYPVTNVGRVLSVILMVMGVSAFSVLTSFLASTFLSRRVEK